MNLQSNPELELAYQYVNYTNRNIYLTGKAGTGKTTFLQRIKEESIKRMAVVAPTGVAAINAGGMTIHSLFQLPFGPFLPGNAREVAAQRRFSKDKIRLIRSLDLLIIDEISMVRADLLDGVDDVLRRYKDPKAPFGGVQLLMVGDLHQLPPVVKDEEWYLLREHYQTPYFFGSLALRQTRPVVIELKHIFRQSDNTFIRLLNKVRNNEIDQEVLDTLNSRFDPKFKSSEEEPYITLTTHNASANRINAKRLDALPGVGRTFKAKIEGNFPEHAYPADEKLELKTGAQVMFLKNDLAAEKRYYNGKIGKITYIGPEEVRVRCPGESEDIVVGPTEWTNVKYTLNEQTKEVEEENLGSFTQIPLRLAWAITIHKSQGLTFERVILDAEAAFAHGQVYVALSRCKSFEGIVLHSEIKPSGIRTDSTVQNFSEEAEKNAPDEAQLRREKAAYQQSLILELVDFSDLKRYLDGLHRIVLEHERSLQPGAIQQFEALAAGLDDQLLPVAEKFGRQLRSLFGGEELPEADGALQDRIRKAGAWFADKIKTVVEPAVKEMEIVSDNQKVLELGKEALDKLQRELFAKNACFELVQSGFSTNDYLRAKTNAELDYQTAKRKSAAAAQDWAPPKHAPNPELYERLRKWRLDLANEKDVAAFQILPNRSLFGLVELLPQTEKQLKKVHGIGKGRIEQYGADLLEIIHDYCLANSIQPPPPPPPEPPKPPKSNTKQVSYELFRMGKNIEEIAAERGYVRSTIEGHLAHFIGLGELEVTELIKPADVEKIARFLSEHPDLHFGEVKTYFGEEFSYGELKMVRAHLERAGK